MPELSVSKSFEFAAAHHLTDYHGKCEHPHGHNYVLEVTVTGEIKKNGLVMDFVDIKKIVKENVIAKLDHTDLNDRFKNPSAEIVAIWIWEQLESSFPGASLKEVKLWETPNSWVSYHGPKP